MSFLAAVGGFAKSALSGALGGAAGQPDNTSFSGGNSGGVVFNSYKSADQNTILITSAIVFIAIIVLGKK